MYLMMDTAGRHYCPRKPDACAKNRVVLGGWSNMEKECVIKMVKLISAA